MTPAQHRVYDLLIQGKSNGEIASALHIHEKTVKGHVTAIIKETGVKRRGEVIAKHFQNGQISA